MSGSKLKVNHDNGTEETLVLKEENRLIQVMESSADPLRVRIDFESVTDVRLLIQTEGSVLLELKETVGFKENPSTVFMDIGGILRITGVKPGIGAGHAAGHFRMYWDTCLVLEERVDTVYWRASLSCAHAPQEGGLLHLEHDRYGVTTPEIFVRDVLRFWGMLIIEE